MTNALAEIGLVLVSVAIGLFNLPLVSIGFCAGAALAWWLIVHQSRLLVLAQAKPAQAIGRFGVSVGVISVMHGLAYGLGYAFAAILGLK